MAGLRVFAGWSNRDDGDNRGGWRNAGSCLNGGVRVNCVAGFPVLPPPR